MATWTGRCTRSTTSPTPLELASVPREQAARVSIIVCACACYSFWIVLALARGSGRRGICCCPPTGCQRLPPSLSPTRPPPPPRVAIFFSLFLSFFLFKLVRADEGKAKAAQNQKLGARDFHPGAASWQAPPTIPHAGHQRGRDGRGALESPNGIRARAKGGAVLAFRGRAGSAAKQHAGLRLVVVEPGGDLPGQLLHNFATQFFFLTVTCPRNKQIQISRKTATEPRD
jgi:hypothetical protein